MKKKIAFLTSQFNEVKSGPGRFTEYLKSLEFENLDIHFFSEQIKQETSAEHPVLIPKWAQKFPLTSFMRALFFNLAVRKKDRELSFDYILAADYTMAMFLDRNLLRKTAVMVNDDNFLLIYSKEGRRGNISLRRLWSRKLGFFLERNAVRSSAFSVANSLYTKHLIEKMYKMPPEEVVLLYKAVDLSWFEFTDRAVRPPRRFLFVKNDWKRGGLDLILSAFSQLSYQIEIQLIIAGISPEEESQIHQLIVETGFKGKAEVVGLLNREKLKSEFQQADVFLNFSRQEALGVSCLEAMSSGLPVLASDAGGLKEVLRNGEAGFMIPAGDVAALVGCLNDINAHPEKLQVKAKAAITHVETFSVQRLRINMDQLFPDKN
ncbi:MAG TPA: glycosyltransferase family 4 protein [Catalimonadaceae bacterium]|nr:glycosyltransferase family 4 protein [Catalimonadaceae bacterium]